MLFYGARLREGAGGGPLDFYVLTDSNAAYHGAGLAALFNRILPPNVYHEIIVGPPRIEAKVAVASMAAFRTRMRVHAIDTSFWARFTQPVTLAWARNATDRDAAIDAVATAVETAAWWAAHLAPADTGPEAAWQTLFRHTYGQELRVESGGRADSIVSAAPGRYQLLHRLLIEGVPANQPAAARSWRRRRRLGKALNMARLVKAAFTYRGGFAYALSKIERHSGRPVELRPWERRLPWLAAPVVAWRLWREGRLR